MSDETEKPDKVVNLDRMRPGMREAMDVVDQFADLIQQHGASALVVAARFEDGDTFQNWWGSTFDARALAADAMIRIDDEDEEGDDG